MNAPSSMLRCRRAALRCHPSSCSASSAADKRAIQDGIEEILWIAALKPTNIGIPEFRDETREVAQARNEAERRLRLLERYADLFVSAADGMVVVDPSAASSPPSSLLQATAPRPSAATAST